MTQRFLQDLINGFIEFKRQTRLSTSEDLIKSLTQELSTHETDLKSAQDQWAMFQRTNNVGLLEEESKSVGMFLADENVELAHLNLERELLAHGLSPEITEANPKADGTNQTHSASATNTSLAVSSPTDIDIKSAQVALMLAREELAEVLTNGQGYKEKPLDDRIAQIQQNLTALMSVNAAQRKAELDETTERMAAISNAIPGWQANVADSNTRLSEADKLRSAHPAATKLLRFPARGLMQMWI